MSLHAVPPLPMLRRGEMSSEQGTHTLYSLTSIDVRWAAFKQTFNLRRWGRVGETGGSAHSIGGPAHSDGVAICRSSNA